MPPKVSAPKEQEKPPKLPDYPTNSLIYGIGWSVNIKPLTFTHSNFIKHQPILDILLLATSVVYSNNDRSKLIQQNAEWLVVSIRRVAA